MDRTFAARVRTSTAIRTAARAGAFALAYFAAAELGHLLTLTTPHQTLTAFWPPAGLLLGALARLRPRHWLVPLVAASVANVASDLVHELAPLPYSLVFCAINAAQACLGAWLLRRASGGPPELGRVAEVLALACLAAPISAAVGATLAAALVALSHGAAQFGATWLAWFVAEAIGMLVVAPVVLTWTGPHGPSLAAARPARLAEGAAATVGLVLTAQAIFGGWLPPPMVIPVLILPFLLWAGWRFGPAGAAAEVLVLTVIGAWSTAHGSGPFATLTAEPAEQLLRSQAALSVFGLCVLVLAASVAERQRAEQRRALLIHELQQALAEIKTLRGLIPVCAWCKKIRDDGGFWRLLEDYLRAHADIEFTHGICPECMQKQSAGLPQARPGDVRP
jgi:integral membrane sensor domain MASE1